MMSTGWRLITKVGLDGWVGLRPINAC